MLKYYPQYTRKKNNDLKCRLKKLPSLDTHICLTFILFVFMINSMLGNIFKGHIAYSLLPYIIRLMTMLEMSKVFSSLCLLLSLVSLVALKNNRF